MWRAGLLLAALAAVPGQAASLREAAALVELREVGRAAPLLRELIRAEPHNAEAWYLLGRVALLERDEAAISYLERAVELDGRNGDHHAWLGKAYGLEAMRVGVIKGAVLALKARSLFDRAVSLDHENVEGHEGLAAFYALAPSFLGGTTARALRHAREVARRDPLRSAVAVALVHANDGEFGKAEAILHAALRRFPASAKLRIALGLVYQSQKKFGDANRVLESAIELDPTELGAWYQVGRTAVLSRTNYARGAECLRHYLRGIPPPGEPSAAWAWYRLGQIHEATGDIEQARSAYAAAVARDASLRGAARAVERLRK